MPKFPYQFFYQFVVRTPTLTYKEIFKQLEHERIDYEKIWQDPLLKEAIYLASPYFYQECDRHFSEKPIKENRKLYYSLLKYYIRMGMRCTPFGLFSGIGTGTFNVEKSSFCTDRIKIRDTKLDMFFLTSLSQILNNLPHIRNQLLFYPNNSIYTIGENIRYIEYIYEKKKRNHIISSAPLTEELEKILRFSRTGKRIHELIAILVNEEISSKDAEEYITELIDNQVLSSELSPNVMGNDFLDETIVILHKINAEKEAEILWSIKNKIENLDHSFGNSFLLYEEIESLIKKLSANYEQQYLFQTDLYFNEDTKLPYPWKKDIKKGISFLNKITMPPHNTHLKKFKKAFYERFEHEEVSLCYALDKEIGIGYRQDIPQKGMHPYLEDIKLSSSIHPQSKELRLNPVQIILNKKLQEVYLEKKYVIQLVDEDFLQFQENWNDLPSTMYFLAEIISENHHEKLCLGSGSGNAGRLLGRFCSEKSEVRNLTIEIAKKEEELSPEHILAEIVHLPEARIGNILRRPTLRKFEIPYLAKSILPTEAQLSIEDLYISIKNNKIILRSKKYNKEIRPLLTNAHNYSDNSLPIYHFLCDLETQDKRYTLQFDWGDLLYLYDFLPRLEYDNIILSKAKWKIKNHEIKNFLSLVKQKELLQTEIKKWRNKLQIPKYIQWVKFDNTLFVDLENYDLLSMFLSSVKSEKTIIIEEFLYPEKDNYTSQYVFPIYKDII